LPVAAFRAAAFRAGAFRAAVFPATLFLGDGMGRSFCLGSRTPVAARLALFHARGLGGIQLGFAGSVLRCALRTDSHGGLREPNDDERGSRSEGGPAVGRRREGRRRSALRVSPSLGTRATRACAAEDGGEVPPTGNARRRSNEAARRSSSRRSCGLPNGRPRGRGLYAACTLTALGPLSPASAS
jgi:hypothetical protein